MLSANLNPQYKAGQGVTEYRKARKIIVLPVEGENYMGNFRGEWIPCSERLPSSEDMKDIGVIATVEGRERNVSYKHGVVSDAWYEDGKWYLYGVLLETAKVTAWMPFPGPYREGES